MPTSNYGTGNLFDERNQSAFIRFETPDKTCCATNSPAPRLIEKPGRIMATADRVTNTRLSSGTQCLTRVARKPIISAVENGIHAIAVVPRRAESKTKPYTKMLNTVATSVSVQPAPKSGAKPNPVNTRNRANSQTFPKVEELDLSASMRAYASGTDKLPSLISFSNSPSLANLSKSIVGGGVAITSTR
jgi:hypothetical protein